MKMEMWTARQERDARHLCASTDILAVDQINHGGSEKE